MTQDANDILMGGGIKSASFKEKGAKVSGIVARKPEVQQQRDFDSGKPLTWDDGKPREQIKVVLSTDLRDDEDDDGERAVYLKGGMLKAVREAVKAAGEKGIAAGGKLAIKYVKDGERKGKLNPPKIYAAKYEAPDPMAVVAASEPAPAQAEDEGLDDF